IMLSCTAQYTYAKHFLCTAVIGHCHPGFLLYHGLIIKYVFVKITFYFAFSTTATSLQHLFLLNGRVSSIRTVSPIPHSFFSSCAIKVEVLLTNLWYFVC